jgi:hypothetical protein
VYFILPGTLFLNATSGLIAGNSAGGPARISTGNYVVQFAVADQTNQVVVARFVTYSCDSPIVIASHIDTEPQLK